MEPYLAYLFLMLRAILSPLPFGVLPPPVTPASKLLGWPRAGQIGTAAMSQFSSRRSLPVRGDNLHKVLRCGKLKFS